MHRCNKCGHHHIPDKGQVTCLGTNYDDDGGISRCGCRHTKDSHVQPA